MTLPADWHNPTPTLAETGIDAAALARLAGNRMLLFSLPPVTVEVPVRDQLRRYEDVAFRASVLVVPVEAARIRARLRDFAGYVGLIPNTEEARIVDRRDAVTCVEYVHAFQLSMMTLRTRIRLRHCEEADGTLSAALIDGDADAAVSRWEIIPLDARRSLVVFINWADIASTHLVLQMLLNAQPDLALAAPYGAAFVAMDAIRQAFDPVGVAPAACPSLPVIPEFPSATDEPLLRRLADAGPVALVDAGQWLRRDDEVVLQRFVAVGRSVDAPVVSAFRNASRFERFPEFFPLVLKAVPRGKAEPLTVDWQVGIALGFFSMGVQYRLSYARVAETRLHFYREAGDIADIDGAWDWQALPDGRCLGAMTIGYRIGPQPPLVLRVARHLPHHDILAGLYMGLASMQRLRQWLPAQEDDGANRG